MMTFNNKLTMAFYFKVLTILYLLIISHETVNAQKDESPKISDTTFTLAGDTLFSNTGLKIYVGQKLLIGPGTAENGWYKTIGFKSDINWPVLLFNGLETKNNYDYQSNPQKRINDKVRQNLFPGDSLIVVKIKKKESKHYGSYYKTFLRTNKFPKVNFQCNIVDALLAKELLVKETK